MLDLILLCHSTHHWIKEKKRSSVVGLDQNSFPYTTMSWISCWHGKGIFCLIQVQKFYSVKKLKVKHYYYTTIDLPFTTDYIDPLHIKVNTWSFLSWYSDVSVFQIMKTQRPDSQKLRYYKKLNIETINPVWFQRQKQCKWQTQFYVYMYLLPFSMSRLIIWTTQELQNLRREKTEVL